MRLLWALVLLFPAVSRADQLLLTSCQRGTQQIDVFSDGTPAAAALVGVGTQIPTLVGATVEGPRVHFDPVWGIDDLDTSGCRKPPPDGPPQVVVLTACLFFIPDSADSSQPLPVLVASHDAMPFHARVVCTVNPDTSPGAPLCAKIRILDRKVPVDFSQVPQCSLGH